MAVDEALLESARLDPDFRPVLRFYSWESPCLSVGYFQDLAAVAGRLRAERAVRRITGGGTVVHGTDLTFSLTLRHPGEHLPAGVKESYLKINEALRVGLLPMFPALDYAPCGDEPSGRARGGRICFEEPSCYDLMIGPKKVVGSSQRRKDGALLHQCSVFLRGDAARLRESIVRGFERTWALTPVLSELTAGERRLAEESEAGRYALPDWSWPSAR